MAMTHRLQILLDEPRYRRLAREAGRRHTSVAAVIRDAIDEVLPDARDVRRQGAIAEILAAVAMPVPADPGDLRRETDAARRHVDS